MQNRTLLALVAVATAVTACTAILGDFDVGPGGSSDDGGSNDVNVNSDDAPANGDAGCPASQTSCGSACVDLKASADNCGKCGKTCFAGTCASSACSTYVVAKQPTTGAVAKLATDGTRVFWADTGLLAVLQIPAGGGAPITLASNSAAGGTIGTELALANGVVAFNYDINAAVGIAKVDEADSGVAMAPAGQAVDALSLSKSGAHVFYINHGGTMASLDDYILADGGSGTGAGGGQFLRALASDDTYLFFDLTGADIFPANAGLYMYKIGDALTAGNPEQFTSPAEVASSVAVDGTWAYWTESIDGGPAYVVQRTLEATPNVAFQTPIDFIAAPAFATDGVNLYYWNGTSVASRSVAGGPETVIAPAAAFKEIAVGGGLLVWTDGFTINGLVLP